jgi:aspartyl/asparaginyl beta-hydroxylase (cupin superfamily)
MLEGHVRQVMAEDVSLLIRQAEAAANAGRWDEAETIWREVRRRDPRNPKAAFSLGIHAMQRRDLAGACALIEEARQATPRDPFLLLTLSRARRERGDDAGESEAIEAALAIDPYYLPALLAKAQRLERLGARGTAAMYFRSALKIAPPEPHWPEPLRVQLQHARDVSDRHAAEFYAFVSERISSLQRDLPPSARERWTEAASIMAGRTAPYHSVSNQLCVPRLPAIPFYDRSMFPWAAELEAKTDAIREELKAALAKEGKEFTPYIKLRPGQPVDQWEELNQSARWSHYSLWRSGKPDEAHLAQCPETRKALEAVDVATIGGICPNAMFSALAPHTEIPPHHGETNARLVVHLPLIVPENCTYRVGFEHRKWEVGKILVFDDTIEHMARNDSDELRVVLIFDTWNPQLTLEERSIVSAMSTAAREFAAL